MGCNHKQHFLCLVPSSGYCLKRVVTAFAFPTPESEYPSPSFRPVVYLYSQEEQSSSCSIFQIWTLRPQPKESCIPGKAYHWAYFSFQTHNLGSSIAFYFNNCLFDFCTWQYFFHLKKSLKNSFLNFEKAFHFLCIALKSPRPGKGWPIHLLITLVLRKPLNLF